MRPTLYEFAGGEPALLRLAAARHARCRADAGLPVPRWSWDGQITAG